MFSGQKHTSFHAQNAINLKSFIVMAEVLIGYQEYLGQSCYRQFAPERLKASAGKIGGRKYPSCPCCGKGSFLHHDHNHYSNYRCGDKRCNHSFFVWKNTAINAPSMSKLFGKHNFKRMCYLVHPIITALCMFYLDKNSFRNISLILRTVFNIKVSHTTTSKCCTCFALLFDDMRIQLLPLLDFNSDEWHADETVVKIAGVKHYLWFVVDSETIFVIGFHISPHINSPQAVSVLNEATAPVIASVISDR